MGNHILMSVLDSHPMLPRSPGEDGFLSFSFSEANYDVNKFIKLLTSGNTKYLLSFASYGGLNKWKSFKEMYKSGELSSNCSGINIKRFSAVQDFSKLTFNVNYEKFSNQLQDGILNINPKTSVYNDYLSAYLNAAGFLDFKKNSTKYDYYNIFSGMRTQLHWICKTFDNVKALVSLRSFDTYVFSHVKSRYGVSQELTDDLINEAWEHWYHKVIDFIWLRLNYPSKVGIVTFDDLINNSKKTHYLICDFLDIEYSSKMENATAFGFPVYGNSFRTDNNNPPGDFYSPKHTLDKGKIPKDYYLIWDNVNKIKLQMDLE